MQIPKAQKNAVKSSVFFALLGFVCLKALSKMFVKSTPDICYLWARRKFSMNWRLTKNALQNFFPIFAHKHA